MITSILWSAKSYSLIISGFIQYMYIYYKLLDKHLNVKSKILTLSFGLIKTLYPIFVLNYDIIYSKAIKHLQYIFMRSIENVTYNIVVFQRGGTEYHSCCCRYYMQESWTNTCTKIVSITKLISNSHLFI